MRHEDFFRTVGPKVGVKGAFDLARDAKISALEKLLTAKGVISQQEIEKTNEKELDRLANQVGSMPKPPGTR